MCFTSGSKVFKDKEGNELVDLITKGVTDDVSNKQDMIDVNKDLSTEFHDSTMHQWHEILGSSGNTDTNTLNDCC